MKHGDVCIGNSTAMGHIGLPSNSWIQVSVYINRQLFTCSHVAETTALTAREAWNCVRDSSSFSSV